MQTNSNLVTGCTLHRRLQIEIDKASNGHAYRSRDTSITAMARDLARAEARIYERLARHARKACRKLGNGHT
jgi:hypothetical protein